MRQGTMLTAMFMLTLATIAVLTDAMCKVDYGKKTLMYPRCETLNKKPLVRVYWRLINNQNKVDTLISADNVGYVGFAWNTKMMIGSVAYVAYKGNGKTVYFGKYNLNGKTPKAVKGVGSRKTSSSSGSSVMAKWIESIPKKSSVSVIWSIGKKPKANGNKLPELSYHTSKGKKTVKLN